MRSRRYTSFVAALVFTACLWGGGGSGYAEDSVPDEFTDRETLLKGADSQETVSTEEYNHIPRGLMLETSHANGNNGEILLDPITGEPLEEPQTQLEKAATMQDIMTMYSAAKYEEVVKALKPLLVAEHRDAQELMGIMYAYGLGVQKDPTKALELLNKAADAGRAVAQHQLGITYFSGNGVPVDMTKALMWLHIAIVHYKTGKEKERAVQDRDNIYARLGRREKEQALQLARDWLTQRGEENLLDMQ